MKRRSVLQTIAGAMAGLLVGWRSRLQQAFAKTSSEHETAAQAFNFALADASRRTTSPVT